MVVAVATERRKGEDRRRGDRRSGHERRGNFMESHSDRRPTPIPYSREETIRLRQAIQEGHATCPSCGGVVTPGPEIPRGNGVAREYRCQKCKRGVMISVS
jgi:tRNA(Ile2) C34 agmatinyltransferase TiaS